MSVQESCKRRVAEALKTTGDEPTVLILDERATQVLGAAMGVSQLMENGVLIVEKLALRRKKYDKMKAVYVMHPSSYEQVIADFVGELHYRSVHLLFLCSAGPYVLRALASSAPLYKVMQSIKELQLNFTLHNHPNEVQLCSTLPHCFAQCLRGPTPNLISTITEELATLITSFPDFYAVTLCCERDGVSQQVTTALKTKLEEMFRKYQQSGCTNYTPSAAPCTIVVLSRTFDSLSPLMRDFHYKPLLYEIQQVKRNELKHEKVFKLGPHDKVFTKFGSQHFMEVMKNIATQFQQFVKQSKASQLSRDKELTLDQMGELMNDMPQFLQEQDRYKLHISAVETLYDAVKQQRLIQNTELQHSAAIGLGEDGKKLKDDFLRKYIQEVSAMRNQQKLRLVLLGLMTLELKPTDREKLMNLISSEQKKILQVLRFMGQLPLRLNQRKDYSQEKVRVNRFQCKLGEVVPGLLRNESNGLKFMNLNGGESRVQRGNSLPKGASTLGRRKISAEVESQQKPRLIVVMLSAIGHNETCALQKLTATHHVVVASHHFVTPQQYLGLLSQVNSQ